MNEFLILDGADKPVETAAIRFVRDSKYCKRGAILHCPLPMARRLVKGGYAEYLKREVKNGE
jgi:hypothetical protein